MDHLSGNGWEILLTNVNIIRLQCIILYIYQDFFISAFFHHTFFCISIKQAWGDFMGLWFVYTCFFPYISLWNELFYCFLFLVYISHLFDFKNKLSLLTLDWLCSNTLYSTAMDARKKDPCTREYFISKSDWLQYVFIMGIICTYRTRK